MVQRNRRQLELARKIGNRPYPQNLERVKLEARVSKAAGELTRDEYEVLEILFEMLERGWK